MNDNLEERLKRLHTKADAVLSIAIISFVWFGTDQLSSHWIKDGLIEIIAFPLASILMLGATIAILRRAERKSD